MLVIKPIEDKNEQKTICRECGIEYNNELFAYKAHDSGVLLACAQFDIKSEYAEIYAMRQALGTREDFEGMFILGRAVMNFLDLCGQKTIRYFPATDFEIRLSKALGFKDENGIPTAHLEGMFGGKCQGHCND